MVKEIGIVRFGICFDSKPIGKGFKLRGEAFSPYRLQSFSDKNGQILEVDRSSKSIVQ